MPSFFPKKLRPRKKYILSVLVIFIVLLLGTGTWIYFARPQPWYPRLRNLLAPPPLANVQLDETIQFDRLEVLKKERWLVAYSKGRPVKVYFVALSKNTFGHKQVEGDRRTPEGEYFIYDKNPLSKYHKNLGISYPNERDKAVAAALGESPGGEIKIHGLGAKHAMAGQWQWLRDWSAGCIVVTNEEIDELYAKTPVGTPIVIMP